MKLAVIFSRSLTAGIRSRSAAAIVRCKSQRDQQHKGARTCARPLPAKDFQGSNQVQMLHIMMVSNAISQTQVVMAPSSLVIHLYLQRSFFTSFAGIF